jgi:ParB family transcriptional regulator, chromosome partitioning protein
MAHTRARRNGRLKSLSVNWLERGSLQPRRIIDGAALKRLADSIKAEGVIQPIFVRKKQRGKFEIIAGERRWHAAKIAGLTEIPSVIRNVSDESALAIALIENLHREDLNPIDQATAIDRLIHEFGMTHQQVADTIGRSRAAVSNLLRLLELPKDVQDMVEGGELDMGHARALLALPEGEQQVIARDVAARHLTVRAVEAMAKRTREKKETDTEVSADERFQSRDTSIESNDDGSYEVRFRFKKREELESAIRELRQFSRQLAG